MILPIDHFDNIITPQKGQTLGDFGKYLLCQGQHQVDALGYSALPINLVQAGFQQLRRIPGANVPNIDISTCDNPTFSTNGTNTLAVQDQQPQSCDHRGPTQCATGTGGAKNTSTPEKAGTQGSGGSGEGSVGANGPGGGADSTSGPDSTTGGAAAPGTTQVACDPDTGTCSSGGGNGQLAGDATALPQATPPGLSTGWQVALMVLAAFLLVALGVAPPLLGQAAHRRRDRRGDSS
jgi:hypothetical protein